MFSYDAPARLDAEDFQKLYQIFLAAKSESGSLEEQGDLGRASLYRATREFFASLARDDAGQLAHPATRSPLEAVPLAELKGWALASLPLSPGGADRIAASSNWRDLLLGIFSDPRFRDQVVDNASSSAPPEGVKDKSEFPLANDTDIIFCYRFFLGRPREAELSNGADERIGAPVRAVARAAVESLEFRSKVLDPMMTGLHIKGGYFDAPPPPDLKLWAATRLPLSKSASARLTAATSWYDVHKLVFSDPLFLRDVVDAASPAAQMSAAPKPRIWPPANDEDIQYCYRLFLGRAREARLAGSGDPRIGAALAAIARSAVESAEFTVNVLTPMKVGKPIAGGDFDAPPSADLKHWAITRLPLSHAALANLAAAESWYEIHKTIVSDPLFLNEVLSPDSPVAQLGTFPQPSALGPADDEDVRFCYRVFLGRVREAHFSNGNDQRVGKAVAAIVREVISSSEFSFSVFNPMMEARRLRGEVFEAAPTKDIKLWAASRLPLSPLGRAAAAAASTWYELHLALFSDARFRHEVVGAESLAIQLASAPEPPMPNYLQASIIEQSMLFERDWYLATYRDVANSGSDPLQHYLDHGVNEERNPNRLFDTRWYLAAHPSVKPERMSPLTHYVLEGARLGYEPHPFFSTRNRPDSQSNAAGRDLTPLARYLSEIFPRDPATFPQFGAYDVYRRTQALERRAEQGQMVRHMALMTVRPTFAVFIDGTDIDGIARTRDSLSAQIYPDLVFTTSKDDLASLSLDAVSRPAYFIWLDAGSELHPEALYELAALLNADPSLALIYFDHEIRLEGGLYQPAHKPDWSPDYLESFNYIEEAACYQLTFAARLLPIAEGHYDFVLRFTELHKKIARIDRVLLTCPLPKPDALLTRQSADIRALAGRLKRTNRLGSAAVNVPGASCYDIRIALSSSPLVSAIIPTAAKIIDYEGRRIDLLVSCLESISKRSTYPNIEFIVVDNGDLDRDRLKHLNISRLKFVTYEESAVNIAKKINLGAAHASGEIILILNDDIEPLAPDWIERMLAHFEKPHVGVVGAKLLYPNQTIQHVGVAVCDGIPQHIRRGSARSDIGYRFSTCGVRNYLAVTGAVSMVRTTDFWQVEGYSEVFPIDYNDMDFCFKFVERGFYIVYEPRAELIHYESVSAVKPPRPQDQRRFFERWSALPIDPYYNECCFAKHPPTFELNYSARRL